MAYAPSPACSDARESASSLSSTGCGWWTPAMMPTLETKPTAFFRLVSAMRITWQHTASSLDGLSAIQMPLSCVQSQPGALSRPITLLICSSRLSMELTCVALSAPRQMRYGCAYLYSAQDIWLEELLIAVGMVYQCTIVHDGVHLAAQLLVDALLQAQVRLRQIAWRQTTSLSASRQACLASPCFGTGLLSRPVGLTKAPCRGLQAEMFTAGMPDP